MASPSITITIAGISGKLGGLIAKHLLKDPSVHINGTCRKPSTLSPFLIENRRVTLFQAASTESDKIRESLRNSSVVICCYYGDNNLMLDGQKTLIDACIAEKVPRYVASDWSLDYRRLSFGDHPAKDPMKHVAAYLDGQGDKIKAVHVMNGCFIEAPWRSIWDGRTKTFKYWGNGDEKWDITSYENAAEFTAKLALDKDAVGYKCFRGDFISIKAMAGTYKEVYGEEPKTQCLGSLEDLYKTMHRVKEQNAGNVWSYLPMFYTYYSSIPETKLPSIDNDLYPDVKLDTIRDYFQKTPIESIGHDFK